MLLRCIEVEGATTSTNTTASVQKNERSPQPRSPTSVAQNALWVSLVYATVLFAQRKRRQPPNRPVVTATMAMSAAFFRLLSARVPRVLPTTTVPRQLFSSQSNTLVFALLQACSMMLTCTLHRLAAGSVSCPPARNSVAQDMMNRNARKPKKANHGARCNTLPSVAHIYGCFRGVCAHLGIDVTAWSLLLSTCTCTMFLTAVFSLLPVARW